MAPRASGAGTWPGLRRGWDRRAWAAARPDKVIPADGAELRARWVNELADLGFTPPERPVVLEPTAVGRLNRDAVTRLVLSRLGARRSSWNAADIRGGIEKFLASVDIVTSPPIRRELAEDLVARTVQACEPLLERPDVPDHVRSLTSTGVLEVEADLIDRLAARQESPTIPGWVEAFLARSAFGPRLDHAQQRVVAVLAGDGRLLVIEGAAGAGKTATLAVARELLEQTDRRLVVVTPTLRRPGRRTAGGRRRVLGRLADPPARLPLGRGRKPVARRYRTRPEGSAAARRRPPDRRGRNAGPGHRPCAARHRR